MIETGVNLSLQDNVSSSSRRIASELDGIARSADGVNSAFDPRILDEYDRKLTQIGESYSKLNNQVGRQEQAQATRSRQIAGMFNTAGTSVAQAGRGDVGGAGLSAGKGIASMIGGKAGIAAAVAVAVGVGTNKLANIYGERTSSADRIASLSGDYGTDIGSNTSALREAMISTTDAVAKYGKTFEEGAKARETYLVAGGRDFSESKAAAYSKAYGLDFNRAASFEGVTERYGQARGLDWSNAIRRAQGLPDALLGEVMEGMQDIFTQGLSSGVVKSLPEIGRSMEFISRAGETFQGGLGAQRLQGLNQAVSGAAGLQSQSDLFLYRAASGLPGGGGLLETREIMEEGFTPELFEGLMKEFDRVGYGEIESVTQLSKMFGLSTKDARKMYGLRGEEALSQFIVPEAIPEDMGKTIESQYIGDLEKISSLIIEKLGAPAFDARATVVGSSETIIDSFQNMFTGGIDTMNVNEIVVSGRTRGIGGGRSDASFEDLSSALTKTQRGVSIKTPLLKQIEKSMEGGVSQEAIMNSLGGSFLEYTEGSSSSGSRISGSEMSQLNLLFQELIEETKRNTAAILEPMELSE